MAFNYTNLTDATDFTAIFRFANDVTEGIFGPFLLLAVFLIIFISMKPFFSGEKCLASASYMTVIFAFVLRTLDVIGDQWMIMSIVAVALSSILLLLSKK